MRYAVATITAAILALVWIPPILATKDAVRSAQWFLSYLDVQQAHSIATGAGVTVGVPDSGVQPHPDLRNNLLPGVDIVAGGDGNGKSDQVGHGSQMAGLIAAHGRGDNVGALGIAPAAKILPIKIFGATDQDIELHSGIRWATEHGAQVINISSSSAPSPELEQAIKTASTNDSILVAASGNRSEDPFQSHPSDVPEVLAVGAIGKDGKHADYSVSGAEVDLCAPGTDIVTTGLNGSYRKTDGTSAATAIVSGAAALVRSRFPELSAQEVIHRLTYTATDIGPPGRDDECGYGALNIVKALTADVPPLASTAGPSAGSPSGAMPSSASGEDPGADAPRSDPSGSALLMIVGGGAAIGAVAVLLALFVSRRRRRPQ